jgi:hypothetical protein
MTAPVDGDKNMPRSRVTAFARVLGYGADASEAARVLMSDEPIGPCRAALRQDALEVLEPAGEIERFGIMIAATRRSLLRGR